MKFIFEEVYPTVMFSKTFDLLRYLLEHWSFKTQFICLFQSPCFWLLIKKTVDINCILSDWLIFGLFLENFDGCVLIQHITLKYREQLTIMQYPKGKNIFVNKM